MKPQRPFVIAHRGFSSRYPENTLAAIHAALELQVDMVEVDVAQTSDGVPVIIHDEDLSRTSNGKGQVNKTTFSQLRELDAGSWFSKSFKAEKIPSLDEVMELVAGKAILLLELKGERKIYPGMEKRVADLIRKHKASDWVIVQSFENHILETFRKEFPEILLHKLVTGNLPVLPLHIDSKVKFGRITRYKTFNAINIKHKLLNRRKLKKIRERGQKVFVWTVNDVSDMNKMAKLGVDGIITDFPDRLQKLFKQIYG